MTREKNNFQMSSTYEYVTKLFLESEFQHKGNKQMKKLELSAKSCSFLGRTESEIKIFKYYTEEDKKKYLDKIVMIRAGTYLKETI